MTDLNIKAVGRALGISEEEITLYPSSLTTTQGITLQMVMILEEKWILSMGEGAALKKLEGQYVNGDFGVEMKLCPLTHLNRLAINELLPYTMPIAFGRNTPTFGVGDRLGLATPGHIRVFRNRGAKPILSQQSKRELGLTGRTYEKVLDDVCFAVFQEGYQGGFGADGDHLKSIPDIEEALNCGYTMITLDCSEEIGRGVNGLSPEKAKELYLSLPIDYRNRIEGRFLLNSIQIADEQYQFNEDDLVRCALIYGRAIDFVEEVYQHHIANRNCAIDFELSIDETEAVTTPLGHLFVAMELEDRGVEITSLAPRFVGEFQKGIDYIGDLDLLEIQVGQHARIADYFGYKLSIHSGSDKFSAFPMIGRNTNGRFHIKTSGTNWLEAVSTIALCAPHLYRKIHQKALRHFEEARQYYSVSADLTKITELAQVADQDLLEFLANDNSRQLLHITYGFILRDSDLKQEIYQVLREKEETYYNRLVAHIGRHLDLLQIRRV
jgi:hypothetical protein